MQTGKIHAGEKKYMWDMCNDKSGVADGGEGKDQGAWGEVRLTRIYRFSGWPSPMHSGYNDIWTSCFDKDMCKIYTIQCQCHIQYKSYFRNEEITSGSVITYTHCSTFPFQRELLSSSPCFSLRGFFRAIT